MTIAPWLLFLVSLMPQAVPLASTIQNEKGPVADSGTARWSVVVYPPKPIVVDDSITKEGRRCYFVYLLYDDAVNYERIEWCSVVERWCRPEVNDIFNLPKGCVGKMTGTDAISFTCDSGSDYCTTRKILSRRHLTGPVLTCAGTGCLP